MSNRFLIRCCQGAGLWLLLLGLPLLSAAEPAPVPVDTRLPAVGEYIQWLAERPGEPLDAGQAREALRAGAFHRGTQPILNFGINRPPHWLALWVENPGNTPVSRRIEVRNSWIDRLDAHLFLADGSLRQRQLGDRMPFAQRPVPGRFLAFDTEWPPGRSLLLMRVETPDPMMLPVALGDAERLAMANLHEGYGYGALYGLVVGLLAFNLVLYLRLRMPVYLAYVLFLGAFLLMNQSYTGHGFWWWWPQSPNWQQWANVAFIALFGLAQMQFALAFLQVRKRHPRAWKLGQGMSLVMALLVALAALAGAQGIAVFLAIAGTMTLALYALALGIHGVLQRQAGARLFVAASSSSLAGGIVTAVTVMDWVPFTSVGYHAVEAGVAMEAVLLSIALSAMLREARIARMQAEQVARTDPLTRTFNRRAFIDDAEQAALEDDRQGNDSSCMLLDLDHFKQLNDQLGHAAGDEALCRVSDTIAGMIRKRDILARWGGEEFVIYLPDTDEQAAERLAQRIRRAISALGINNAEGRTLIRLTVSIGVVTAKAGKKARDLEDMIRGADLAMYQAKEAGRNRVMRGSPEWTPRDEGVTLH